MKPALVATVVLAFAVYFAPRCKAEQRPPEIAQSTQSQNPTPPAPPVGREGATANNYSYYNQPPAGDTAPQWILVIVGFVTAGFICWQALETRRAAQATQDSVGHMEQSVKLQELAFAQWVIADNWQAGYPQVSGGGVGYMHVTFDIVNQTKFPLTLQSVKAKVLDSDSEIGDSKPHFLPPDGKHRFGIHVGIKDAKASSLGGIEFSPFLEIINVFVEYDGVLKKRQTQELGAAVEMQSAVKSTFMPLMIDITPKTKS